MRKMKDSGIEWIGEIPEGWEVTKIKHIVSSVTDIDHFMPDSVESGIPYLMIGNLKDLSSSIDWDSSKKISIEDYKKLSIKSHPQKGDIIFARYASIGTTCYIDTDRDFLVSYACLTIHPSDSIIGKFLSYYLKSSSFAEDALRRTNSNTQGNVGKDSLVNATIVLPSIIEQAQIVNFLDAKCSDIYAILSKTRASIEEYKKLKQAVITQAVTKGVRGEREMKDSGVAWIGEIPKEFDSVQLKFFCKLITDGTHFSPITVENGFPYITAGDVHGIGLDYNSAKRISEEDFQLLVAQGCQPLKGDVLLVKDGATTGRVGFVDSDTPCVILSSVAMLRPADNTDGHYLMYLLASDFLQKQILVSMAGSAMPRTTLTKLTKYIGLLPPLHEQKEIADYLDVKCAEIDGLIAKKEQLVKELESYKKSLIYEVVTGKREV